MDELPEELRSPQCEGCKHLRRPVTGAYCRAFPQGIPFRIWIGELGHNQPYPGDHGIQYEPLEGADDDL